MKIELAKVQFHQSRSQETFCFSADLIVDGVARGTVENRGQGGPHRYSDRSVEAEIDAYAATQPRRTYPAQGDDTAHSLAESAELLVNDQVTRHAEGKRLRKLLASKIILVTQKGHVASLKATPEQIEGALIMRAQDLVAHYGRLLAKSSPDDLPIASLNHAPFEVALDLFLVTESPEEVLRKVVAMQGNTATANPDAAPVVVAAGRRRPG